MPEAILREEWLLVACNQYLGFYKEKPLLRGFSFRLVSTPPLGGLTSKWLVHLFATCYKLYATSFPLIYDKIYSMSPVRGRGHVVEDRLR